MLEKNPDYWGTDEDGTQLPYLDKLTVVPIPDSGQRVNALETGDIDMFQTADSKTDQAVGGRRASRPRRSAAPAPPSC